VTKNDSRARGARGRRETVVALPDLPSISGKGLELIDRLRSLPKDLSRSEAEIARGSIRDCLGEIRVGRHGIGRADLRPQNMVAGVALLESAKQVCGLLPRHWGLESRRSSCGRARA
jgi:hypothetical protein